VTDVATSVTLIHFSLTLLTQRQK